MNLHLSSKKCAFKQESGAILVLVAVLLVALIAFAAFAIDLGYRHVVKNELQNIADGAALAATRELGLMYEKMSYEEQQLFSLDGDSKNQILSAAKDIATKNTAGGITGISIDENDITIGQWDALARKLDITNEQPDAVRVIARRDSVKNQPISTFFAKFFGVETLSVAADATAALTALSNVGEGGLKIPVGISKAWYAPNSCDQPIKFYPTGDLAGCAGWHTFFNKNANASALRDILNGMTPDPPTYTSPPLEIGDSVEFTGGNVASAMPDLKDLYDAKKDADGKWEVLVIVYDYVDCSNPKQNIPVVGFSTAIITGVDGAPDHTITAEVKCDNVEPGRGGGGEFGTKGSIPGLVE